MEFNLDRDIVFFDIEATGLNVITDRIVQIALIKYLKDGGQPEELELLINPKMPISPEAQAVHGFSNEQLADKPTFFQVAREIYKFIGDADLAGYNSDRFDIPMLVEELYRCGYDLELETRRTIDVQKIFYRMEPRTLKAALQFYCGKELEGAHDALADVRATVDVFKGQIRKYEGVDHYDGDGFKTEAPIKNDMESISKFTRNDNVIDITMRLKYNQKGDIVFNFGKYKGREIKSVFREDTSYSTWILERDFSVQVKKVVAKIARELEAES